MCNARKARMVTSYGGDSATNLRGNGTRVMAANDKFGFRVLHSKLSSDFRRMQSSSGWTVVHPVRQSMLSKDIDTT